uniref:uncharacterized protein n=1 Tax=Myxine glutinosa TaxID=7769 RepID=UPI00358F2D29
MESRPASRTFSVLSLCAILLCWGSDPITADQDVFVYSEGEALLTCNYTGDRVVNSIKWSNKSSGKIIAERSTGKDYISETRITFMESSGKKDGSIKINPVHGWDNGTYTCSYDVQGKMPTEKTITLSLIPRPPTTIAPTTKPLSTKSACTPCREARNCWKILIVILVIFVLCIVAVIIFYLYKTGNFCNKQKPRNDEFDEEVQKFRNSRKDEEDQKGSESKAIKKPEP